MAILQDLIAQIPDASLRSRISAETQKLLRQKKFGLVFEDHIPECCPLYDVPIRCGSTVARRSGSLSELYTVLSIDADNALCAHRGSGEKLSLPIADLLSVAEFGKPIYPYLAPVASLSHAPASAPWHTLIEADNFHALQLLAYLYPGKVDCIYIDPPYNTGARDWKYNNDYVDGSDAYRHSKWLSMMEKRLRLAKKLLNPADSVLIVTIDEKEYLHLGCLLEEMFPEARMQMVTTVINPSGKVGDGFSVVSEYIFLLCFGCIEISRTIKDMLYDDMPQYDSLSNGLRWQSLLRGGSAWSPASRPNLFYPVLVDTDEEKIVGVGSPTDLGEVLPSTNSNIISVYPIKRDGSRGIWRLEGRSLMKLVKDGFAYLSSCDKSNGKYSFQYLLKGDIDRIASGEIKVARTGKHGEVQTIAEYQRKKTPKNVWKVGSHNAGTSGGSVLLNNLIGRNVFSFPKSLYAVLDTIRFFVANKPRALILDFFAGSGTTLHAVNLLNAEDGGERRCILVTNNEVSDAEAKALTARGHRPGDSAWEALGIARYVTWPRTVCSMEGHDVNGVPLKGEYLGTNRPMADGFSANAVYFKLGFLDKVSVSLGRQFREILPLLWMKAGARGACPELAGEGLPEMLILPENGFAVLLEETAFPQFEVGMRGRESIETVYLVTNHAETYRAMSTQLGTRATYQLYKDYLDNFRINHFNRT